MGTYASVADVQARLSGRTIDATSKPSDSQVSGWIDETEAELEGYLAAAGFATPIVGTKPVAILRSKVVSKVSGRTERAYSSGTDLEENVGEDLVTEYADFLTLVQTQPDRVARMLGVTAAGSSSESTIRTYPTDNVDSKTIAGGDFEPTFSRSRWSRTSTDRW